MGLPEFFGDLHVLHEGFPPQIEHMGVLPVPAKPSSAEQALCSLKISKPIVYASPLRNSPATYYSMKDIDRQAIALSLVSKDGFAIENGTSD
jgi:hypothetical protein